jgi:ketol-acid reductoisomerase
MASRSFSKAIRNPLGRQLASPAVQRRSLLTAARGAVRATAIAPRAAVVPAFQQQTRGVKNIDFAGVREDVYGMLNAKLPGFTV